MDKFLATLQDPFWWFSVVIVGLLISVVGAAIYRILERYMSRISEQARAKDAEREAARTERIAKIKGSQHEAYLAGLDELRNRMRCVQLIVSGFFLFFLGIIGSISGALPQLVSLPVYFVAALSVAIGWRYGAKAVLIFEEIKESQQELTNHSSRRQQAGAPE